MTARKTINREKMLKEALAAYGMNISDIHNAAQVMDEGGVVAEEVVVALREILCAMLRPSERTQIKSPTSVAQLLMLEMSHLDHEHFRAVLLDTKNRVQDIVTIYVGTLNAAMIRVSEVFKEAIKRNSAAIIICHNHPSGDSNPSPEDVMVTRRIVDAGRLLEIEVLDHLVIGQGRYVSMRERGLGFAR